MRLVLFLVNENNHCKSLANHILKQINGQVLLYFVVASDVYIRNDVRGDVTRIEGATVVIVYFLSKPNATISVELQWDCSDWPFSGDMSVRFRLYEA